MKFTYTGTDKEGNKVTETVEAEDRFAVYDIARQAEHTIDEVSEERKFSFKSLLNMEKINTVLSSVKIDELALFARNLSSMLAAGLALSRCLSVLERQSKNPKLVSVTKKIQAEVNKGTPFYEALGKYPKIFSPLFIAMVRAGEESGTLSESLKILSAQIEQASNLQKKIKGAMIYPVIVITIMLGIGVLMMIFVMPTIIKTFQGLNVDLPLSTQILIGTSTFMSAHTIATLALLVLIPTSFIALGRTMFGKKVLHYLVVRIPVIGNMVKEVNAARTARTLSSLLSSGVDMIAAIDITKDVVQNIYYKKILETASARVEKGEALSGAFIEHEELYPVLVGEMILVGEETGDIAVMLDEVAHFYEEEVTRKTKDLSTIIEPLLMVFIGGGVGFFALAMIAPIYSLSDSIG